jgi:hypothetical protein
MAFTDSAWIAASRLSMNMDDFSDKSLYLRQQTAKDWTEVQVFF